jgi:hypothetical protein
MAEVEIVQIWKSDGQTRIIDSQAELVVAKVQVLNRLPISKHKNRKKLTSEVIAQEKSFLGGFWIGQDA